MSHKPRFIVIPDEAKRRSGIHQQPSSRALPAGRQGIPCKGSFDRFRTLIKFISDKKNRLAFARREFSQKADGDDDEGGIADPHHDEIKNELHHSILSLIWISSSYSSHDPRMMLATPMAPAVGQMRISHQAMLAMVSGRSSQKV